MIRNTLKLGVSAYAFLPTGLSNLDDALHNKTQTEKKTDYSLVEKQTGWERLKIMFAKDEFGGLSDEVGTILQVACMSSFIGALYGGVVSSRTAYMDFMRNNQATAFKDHLDAKKKLQDAVTKSFAKGAFRWGWRLTFFTTSFVGVSTMMNVYRGDSSVLDFVTGGIVSGFLYKFQMGPRGWIVGAGLGSLLGLMAGSVTLGILKLSGISMQEARYWQQYWHRTRTEAYNKSLQKQLYQENQLLLMHDRSLAASVDDIKDLELPAEEKS